MKNLLWAILLISATYGAITNVSQTSQGTNILRGMVSNAVTNFGSVYINTSGHVFRINGSMNASVGNPAWIGTAHVPALIVSNSLLFNTTTVTNLMNSIESNVQAIPTSAAVYNYVASNASGAKFLNFLIRGNAYTNTNITQLLSPFTGTLQKVWAYANIAPTGADLTFQVNINGIPAFTNVTPTIAATSNQVSNYIFTAGVSNVVAINNRISINVTQVGSTLPGGNDLMIQAVFQ